MGRGASADSLSADEFVESKLQQRLMIAMIPRDYQVRNPGGLEGAGMVRA